MPMKLDIPAFSMARVLVVGDLMLDRYWQGNASRISPEAPVPVLHVTNTQDRLGGAGNVALNLKALGCQVSLVAVVGQDEAGHILEKQLNQADIHCYLHRLPNIVTTTKLRVLGHHQQLVRLDFEAPLDASKTEPLISDVKKILEQGIDILVLSDYAKGTLHHAQAFIAAAKALNIPVLVDPKSLDFTLYQGATIITPNQKEFEAIVGRIADDEDLITKGYALLQDYDVSALLVTRSEHGMMLISSEMPPAHFPIQAREVYDVTGAGDTVIAVMAASLAVGESLNKSVMLANIAAGLVVQKLGAAAISIDELRQAVLQTMRHSVVSGCIVTEQALISLLEVLRAQGETIVMTNGCFDILHAGHVQYLEQAKTLGDRLIVAINDDQSVRRLKGEKRPINGLQERMSIVAGLRAVDWVVSFSEDTPARLIQTIEPDILVKGEDYQVWQIAGADHVLSKGGRVELLPFKKGCSTSTLIEKISTVDLKEI